MAKDTKKKEKSATAKQIDFTNVKDGGSFNKKRQTAGDYRARITKVTEVAKKDEKKLTMWLYTITVGSGTYPYYCNFVEANQLWKIRNLFIAAGINVPKKRMSMDPNLVVNKEIGVTLEDGEYDGKLQSEIGAVFPTSELDGDSPEGAEDDEPKKKKGKKSVEAPQGGGKKGKHGKKGKAKASDDELEELDIDEI